MGEKFIRSVDGSLIKKMKSEPLWKDFLCGDCKNGEVFLAVRNDAISFYHKGGRLFTYTMEEGFKTHVKYASIIEAKPDEDSDLNYLTEAKLKKYKPISDFASHYQRIKKNCEILANQEALGVSIICKKYSYLSEYNIVVLDIEVTLTSGKERVDILGSSGFMVARG